MDDRFACLHFHFFSLEINSWIEVPKDGEAGSFIITYNGELLDSYNGATDGCFSAKGYIFGDTCPPDIPRIETVGDCVMANGDVSEDAPVAATASSPAPASQATASLSPSPSPSENPSVGDVSEDAPVAATASSPAPADTTLTSLSPSPSPSPQPSVSRSASPSLLPSDQPSIAPSILPSDRPSLSPSYSPTAKPTLLPSFVPSDRPSLSISSSPSAKPSLPPSDSPSATPSASASGQPSAKPSAPPTDSRSRADTCIPFLFFITPDEFPEDVVFSLEGSTTGFIWEERRPLNQDDVNLDLGDSTCLDPFDCFTFTIVDLLDDGLTRAPEGGTNGTFALQFDSEFIASYDGAVDGCYTSKSYTFGQCSFSEISIPPDGSCEPVGQDGDVADTQTAAPIAESNTCIPFLFFITPDEFPEDVVFSLEGLTTGFIWEERRPLNQDDVNLDLGDSTCLDPFDCFTFTIVDLWDDGLTKAPEGGTNGTFALQFDSEFIASYDGAVDGCYTSKSYTFGQCSFSEISIPPDGSCEPVGQDGDVADTQTAAPIVEPSARPSYPPSGAPSPSPCIPFRFLIFTDAFPEDVLFSLEGLTEGSIWEGRRPWTQDDVNQVFAESTCLDASDCFTFTIFDIYLDGLTKTPEGGTSSGTFALEFDSESIASYDGNIDGCYTRKSYTFGQCSFSEESIPPDGSCELVEPDANGDDTETDPQTEAPATEAPFPECSSSELSFRFAITTDEDPHDSLFTLLSFMTGEVVWEEDPWFNIVDGTPQETGVQRFMKILCLDPNVCYTFFVDDRHGNGLTSEDGGFFELQLDGEVVAFYDGVRDGCFSSISYMFGGMCPFSADQRPADGSC